MPRQAAKTLSCCCTAKAKAKRWWKKWGVLRKLRLAKGLPAHVIPLALWHTASTGLDVWLSALSYGAAQVLVLMTDEEAPQYLDGVQAQMAQGQALLEGLGYTGKGQVPLQLVQAGNALELDADLQRLTVGAQRLKAKLPIAPFAVTAEKRGTLGLVIDHLLENAPALKTPNPPEALPLPQEGALFGTVNINKDTCTLCMSCVSACPAQALQDNTQAPQLTLCRKKLCSVRPMRDDLPRKSGRFNLTPFVDPAA